MKRYLSKDNGYTLTEVLITLAIVVVLLAVSIPLIANLRTNLKMKEMDDTARELYIAAQNRLSSMKASGELYEFDSELSQTYASQNLASAFGAVPPGDYVAPDSLWRGFYYITSDNDVTATYVMNANLVAESQLPGKYIIELDPDNGDVYSVFYSESDLLQTYLDTLYTARSDDARRDAFIGYYSGSDASVSNAPEKFSPEISAINKEELYLEITCDDLRTIASTQKYLTVLLTLEDEHGNVWTEDYTGFKDFTINYDTMALDVLLDSMRSDASFADITGLTAGDNITAVVSMEYVHGGLEISTDPKYPATVQFNSLFQNRSDGEITISRLRHLNNLRSSIYSHEGDTDITVTQTSPIDFSADSWDEGALCPTTSEQGNPLERFSPIENEKLFGGSASPGIADFSGGNITNIRIDGGDMTGLFAYFNCDVSGVRLIDPIVTGDSRTGALAGVAYGGSITDCGVFLSTSDEDGTPYDAEYMADSVAQHTVTVSSGSSNAGGLIGMVSSGVTIDASFAAIDVKCPDSGSSIGGLVGTFGGTSITNSYSSGDVTAFIRAGGLVGAVTGGSISNCYSTSDVTAPSYAGGFVGTATGNVTVTGCAAYGLTGQPGGTLDLATSGAFTGSTGAAYSNCVYLRQNGYLDVYDGVTVSGISPQTYTQLRADPANDPVNSYPYTGDDAAGAFPFDMVCVEHFGNWPEEFLIQTSLVYYEKYRTASGGLSYGYYALGYSEGGDESGGNAWVLDTLLSQDELDAGRSTLVEDGYAVLSIYDLARMDYSLNGADTATMTVADAPGTGIFTLLSSESTLSLTNAGNKEFTVENINIYQLPFALQETNRDTVGAFYDTFTLTCYADGNLETPVVSDHVYYYCPHFAKNAVNPDNETQTARPDDPTVVYVRSARQLNALGRYCYYWNKGNSGLNFEFSQELDLNFAAYTTVFCGVSFNLMNTSAANAYRNRPIGRPMNQTFIDWNGNTYTPANFQNVYDGNGRKIIDFCLISYNTDSYQFTGLFGEIYKATIRNIILVASDPENMSGYVISQYNTGTHKPGTGALVGLIYIDGGSESQGIDTRVQNCAVSGYTVIYRTSTAVLADSAVGGLSGFCMGYLENCSAVCKLVSADVPSDGGRVLSVGGLCGSVNGHRLSDCYAGGSLELNCDSHSSVKSSIGGVAGGYIYLWNTHSDSQPFEYLEIDSCYSYCRIAETADDYYTVFGVSGNVYDASAVTLSACYYLKNAIDRDVTVSAVNGAAGLRFSALRDLALSGFGDAAEEDTFPWSDELSGLAFPFPAVVKDARTNAFVHFGDWTVYYPQQSYFTYYERYGNNTFGYYYYDENDELVDSLDHVNANSISAAGYGLLVLSDNEGALTAYDGAGNTLNASVGAAIDNLTNAEGDLYALHPFTPSAIASLSPESGKSEKAVILISDFSVGPDQTSTVYVNVGFGAAISLESALLSSPQLPLQVRTVNQLTAVSGFSPDTGHFIQTHDILCSSAPPALSYGGAFKPGFSYDGCGYSVINPALPMFNSNAGQIADVVILGATITSSASAVAPLAVSNSGIIEHCYVYDTQVTVNGSAGGALFVGYNSGTIRNCYVGGLYGYSSVTGSSSAAVSGFTLENSGALSYSSVSGVTVSGNSGAAGFVYDNSYAGSVAYCSVENAAISSVTDAAGFARTNASSGAISYCSVTQTAVSSGGKAAGFAFDSTGALSYATVTGSNITGNSGAAGFAYSNLNGAVYYCAVDDTSVISPADAAGFIYSNGPGSVISYCFTTLADIQAGGTAAGFAYTNAGGISSCYVSAVESGASLAGYGYGSARVTGAQACGFVYSATGSIDYCYVVGTVSGSDLAAGFAVAANSVTNSYSNCAVTASSGPACGFALSGNSIAYCYAVGTVSGTSSYGFMNSGYAASCYTLCALGPGAFGFAPTGAQANDCYWVSEATFNPAVSAASSAGTKVTFSALGSVPWMTVGTAYPFSSLLGGTYPYTIAYNNIPHCGDWPVSTTSGEYQGVIGVVQASSSSAICLGYVADGLNSGTTATDGPTSLRNSSKAYYVYISEDLLPAFGGVSDDPASTTGWVVEQAGWFDSIAYVATVDGYACYRLNTVWNPNNNALVFYLDGVAQFSITVKNNFYTAYLTILYQH